MHAKTRRCTGAKATAWLLALMLALGCWAAPAWATEDEPEEPALAAQADDEGEGASEEPALAAPVDEGEGEEPALAEPADEGEGEEPALAGPAGDEDEEEDPFVRDGIANIDSLPEDLYVDGGANATAEMQLDFAAIGVPEGVEPDVRIEVGHYLWDKDMPWGESISIDGLATYDEATRTVTVDATRLAGDGGAPLYDGIYVNAFVTWGEGDSETLRITGSIFGVVQGNQYAARVSLDPSGRDNRIYRGESATVSLHTENLAAAEADGYQLIVFVGRWFGHPDFTEAFAAGEGYTYDDASGTVTLDGTYLASLDLDHVDVFALIAPEPAADETFGDGYWESILDIDVTSFSVREPRENYERVWDDDMLPGWEWEVRRWYNLELDTPEHPDGEENHPWNYEVVDVTSSDQDVVNVWKNEWTYTDDEGTHDDWNWRYRAEGYGEATLTVTYLDVDGNEQSYDFCIHVGADRYNVDIRSEDNVQHALLGGSITLFARGWHDRDGDQGDNREETFSYQWLLDADGGQATENELASITWDEADSSTATLTFKDASELGDDIDRWMRVEAVLYKQAEDDEQPVEVRRGDIWLNVSSRYEEVWVEGFDPDLDAGTTLSLNPQLRQYPADNDEGYTLADDVHFRIEDYDDNRLDVDNEALTVTRRNGEDADFQLVAYRTNDQNQEYEVNRKQYRFDHLDYDMRFESGDWARLYSDGTLALTLDAGALAQRDDVRLDWTVGVADDEGHFPYEASEGFSVSGNTITLDGTALVADEQIRDNGGTNIRVRALVGDEELSDAWCWVELRDSRESYDDREYDCSLLPGWEREVHRWYHLELDTAEHPEDEENHPDQYEVTGVTVTEQRRWDEGAQDMVAFPYEEGSDDNVVNVWKSEWTYTDDEGEHNDWSWRYRAQDFGEATLTVTYLDARGNEQTYDFKVSVGGDVYSVDLWNDGASNQALPGTQMTLHAHGWHDYLDFDDDGGYSQQRTEEGFTYDWRIEDGKELASIAVDQNDPTTCVVTFNERPDGQDWYEGHVRVAVRLMVPPNPDDDGERAFGDIGLQVRDDYLELVLDGFDSQLDLGKAIKLTPHLDHYAIDGTAESLPVTRYEWSYDDNAIKIDDNGDGTYALARLKPWGTNLHLTAFWSQDNREERIDGDYWLDEKGYDLFFTCGDDTELYTDWKTTLTLDTSALGSLDYDLTWQLGVADGNGGLVAELPQGAYTTDGTSLTLDGAAVDGFAATHDHGGVNVCARISYNGEELGDAWCWVSLRTACNEHDWSEKVLDSDCEKTGHKRLDCAACHEQRIVEIPALGHRLTAVAKTSATLGKTGTKAHWRCERCGKLFADAAGTQETTTKSLTIPKLINIGTATVSVAKATYTGKALTPAVTAKLGGTTLKKGTDYTVSYKNNVKAGKATVTIAGIGRYGGSKATTFTIAKAANTMTATTKKATAKAAKKTTIKAAKAFDIKNAVGKVTYQKKSGDKKITISKSGKVTVKKGLKKDKTYKVKVTVTAAGDANHNSVSKVVTLKVKVK